MTELMRWMQQYQSIIMFGAIWMGQLVITLLCIFLAQQVKFLKHRIEQINNNFENNIKKALKAEKSTKCHINDTEYGGKVDEEEKNRIISTVLREIFP